MSAETDRPDIVARDESVSPARAVARHVLSGLLITLVTIVVFLPTLGASFVYDDFTTVVGNRLIDRFSAENVVSLLGGFHLNDYYPVFYLSLAVDRALWDFKPSGFHRTNLAIHVLNALLVYALVVRICASGSRDSKAAAPGGTWALALIAGLLFAVHPNHVEPVAWITGRKVLLACLFGLLSVHAYLSSLTDRGRRLPMVIVSLICAALACMSNVYAIVVPALIVLADHLFSARGWWRSAWVNWPFALVACGAVLLKATSRIGGVARAAHFSNRTEWLLTTVSLYWENVRSLVVPTGRNVLYPNRVIRSASDPIFLAGAAAIVVTLALLWMLQRRRPWLFGLLWFLLALAPTSQVARHHIFRADRYLYLPGIGACLVAALAFGAIWSRPTGAITRLVAKTLVTLAVLGVLATFAVASLVRTRDWQNDETLWTASLQQDEQNADAHQSLGCTLMRAGRLDAALRHLERSVQLHPTQPDAHNTLCVLLLQLNRVDDAVRHGERAIQIRPEYAEAKFNLGRAFMAKGEYAPALEQFENGLAQKPTDLGAVFYKAETLARLGRYYDAIRAYEHALAINTTYVEARYGLALALIQTGQLRRADDELLRLVTAHPEFAEAHCRLGELALTRGDYGQAIARFRQAIKARPDLPEPRNNLAWLLATCPEPALRDGAEAVSLAMSLVTDPKRALPHWWDTLAAAYAEAGQFDQAVRTARHAVDLADQAGLSDLANRVRQRLRLYATRRPYHEPAR